MSEQRPIGSGGHAVNHGYSAATSNTTSLTASATPGTLGAWVELIDVTTVEGAALFVQTRNNSSDALSQFSVAIAAGGGEASNVVLADLPQERSANMNALVFPVAVPIGSRIAAALRSATGSLVGKMGVAVLPAHPDYPRGVARGVTYGADTANSAGTTVDSGGSANTLGSWVDMTTSTERDHALVVAMIERGATGPTASAMVTVELGLWNGSAYVTQCSFIVRHTTGGFPNPNWYGPLSLPMPKGSRLGVRSQSDSTDAGARLLRVSVIGF